MRKLLHAAREFSGVVHCPSTLLHRPDGRWPWKEKPVLLVQVAKYLRGQYRPSSQKIVVVYFDLAGGSLKDWCTRTSLCLTQLRVFSGLGQLPRWHLIKALKGKSMGYSSLGQQTGQARHIKKPGKKQFWKGDYVGEWGLLKAPV